MSARTIAVAGDVSVDWLLPSSAGERRAPVDFIWMWGGAYACRAISSSGGAASHAKILRAAAQAAGLSGVTVVGPEVPAEALASPYQRSYTSTYARIQRFPRELGSQGENTAWRIAEFLGSDPSPAAPAAEQGPAPERIDTLLLVDHAQGYRDRPAGLAPLLNAKPRAIVWQTGAPHTGSTLADLLLSEHRDSLTVITSSDELRKSGHQVGYALSWEQLAEEVLGAVAADVISQAQRVIVVIGAVGALIVEREGANVLVFDSRSQEGDWGKRYPGVGAAYGRCIDAAVALGLTGAGEPALIDAVKRGLAAARAAHLCGFVVDFSRDVFAEPFPLEAVAAALARDSDEFASVVFRPAGASILAQTYSEQAMVDVAAATAIAGSSSLPPGIPVETVGSWVSVDRIEIESLRSVRNIMAEYVEQRAHGDRGKQPLSVAVFGPPGAGKTFAVRQLATVILPEQLRTLEFNLSQLRAESDLHSALHRVRDVALEGDLPLVFWDEFDAPCQGEPLGWLQHFLAPMEDGRFRDRGGFHPVGSAIFVFAGGTATRFADFVVYSDERAERAAKKPDFISRLGGYVDVTGPNPQDAADVAWPLRRALLLRSLVAQRAPQMMTPGGAGSRLEIDEGVLRAFLLVGEYIHGARSMAAIVRMSALSGKPRFERASLPARQQLGLHVDADQFLALVRG